MWAIYKLEKGRRLWYGGINGNWSSVSERACQWPDKRDAQAIAIYVRGDVDWIAARVTYKDKPVFLVEKGISD